MLTSVDLKELTYLLRREKLGTEGTKAIWLEAMWWDC